MPPVGDLRGVEIGGEGERARAGEAARECTRFTNLFLMDVPGDGVVTERLRAFDVDTLLAGVEEAFSPASGGRGGVNRERRRTGGVPVRGDGATAGRGRGGSRTACGRGEAVFVLQLTGSAKGEATRGRVMGAKGVQEGHLPSILSSLLATDASPKAMGAYTKSPLLTLRIVSREPEGEEGSPGRALWPVWGAPAGAAGLGYP
ncbi:hypothetical protein BDZ91DRAFT_758798 [Kalaharituber pfeilii]|nr:hypothetical protein BDZ91DRAFT_758798 [Kalaharituber pfeilii]